MNENDYSKEWFIELTLKFENLLNLISKDWNDDVLKEINELLRNCIRPTVNYFMDPTIHCKMATMCLMDCAMIYIGHDKHMAFLEDCNTLLKDMKFYAGIAIPI